MHTINKLIHLIFSVLIMVGCFQTKLNMYNGDDSKESYVEGEDDHFQQFIEFIDDDDVTLTTINYFLDDIDNLNAFYEYEEDMCQLIHIAAANGEGDIINSLISRGVSVNSKSQKGKTVLHYAAAEGWKDLVEDLINKDEKLLTVQDADGNTPLHCAIIGKYMDLAIYLTEKLDKATLTKANKYGYNALHMSASLGMEALSRKLINKQKEMMDQKTMLGDTPLHLSILEGKFIIVKLLLDYGADTSIKNNKGLTPLDFAGALKNQKMIELSKSEK